MQWNPPRVAAAYLIIHLAATFLYLELVPTYGGASFEVVVQSLLLLWIVEFILVTGSFLRWRKWVSQNRLRSVMLALLMLLPLIGLLRGGRWFLT